MLVVIGTDSIGSCKSNYRTITTMTVNGYRYTVCVASGLQGTGGLMVSMFASSEVDRGFEPRSGHIKDYKIGICCFSSEHPALMKKSKDWLARNQNNVSEWGGMTDCCFSEIAL